MEGGVADEKLRDISSARVGDDPMSRTSFGDQEYTEPSALTKCSDDALVDKGTEAPKPRLSLVEMRMLTPAAGDLLHAGSAYKTQGAIFPPRPLFVEFSEKTEKRYTGTTARHTFVKYNRS